MVEAAVWGSRAPGSKPPPIRSKGNQVNIPEPGSGSRRHLGEQVSGPFLEQRVGGQLPVFCDGGGRRDVLSGGASGKRRRKRTLGLPVVTLGRDLFSS